MGECHRKNSIITKTLYYEIKSQLAVPKDDRAVMRLYGISQTTARKIRNTENYTEYRARAGRRTTVDPDFGFCLAMAEAAHARTMSSRREYRRGRTRLALLIALDIVLIILLLMRLAGA